MSVRKYREGLTFLRGAAGPLRPVGTRKIVVDRRFVVDPVHGRAPVKVRAQGASQADVLA